MTKLGHEPRRAGTGYIVATAGNDCNAPGQRHKAVIGQTELERQVEQHILGLWKHFHHFLRLDYFGFSAFGGHVYPTKKLFYG